MFPPSVAQEHGIVLLYHVIGIVCQSICYGVYVTLFPISTYLMIQKGVGTKVRKFLLGMSITMFALSTLYFVLSMASLVQLISDWLIPVNPTISNPSNTYLLLFSALVFINYGLTDGVVVWRAWVLCGDDNRKLLLASMFFLGCTSLTVGSTMAIRIALTVMPPSDPRRRPLPRAIDVGQVGGLVLSLVTNVLATSAVALKAWRRRKEIAGIDIVERTSGAGEILVLLTESGALYTMSLTTYLICVFVRLPHGTLGDLYTPVHTQIAGIYPVVVLLLINQGYSLDKTVFASDIIRTSMIIDPGSRAPRLDTIHFDSRALTFRSEDRHGEDSLDIGSSHMLESDVDSLVSSPCQYPETKTRGRNVGA